MKRTLILLAILTATAGVRSDDSAPVAELPKVRVRATRLETFSAAPDAVTWKAPSSASAVRSQGVAGGLNDLTVNASSFAEAGVTLNGAALRNAHTEHFNADVFMPDSWIGSRKVLTGLDLARTSVGHPAGSVAVSLDRPQGRSGKASFGGGTRGLLFFRGDDLETFAVNPSVDGWVGAFFDVVRADRIDGYRDNSTDRMSAGGRLGAAGDDWQADLLVSGFWRDFGVRGTYGTDEKFPAWENDVGGEILGTYRYDAGDDQPLELTVLWHRERDIYWLDRDNHSFPENRHVADLVSLHGAARRHLDDRFFIDVRDDVLLEAIKSESLGDHSRVQGSLAAIPGVRLGDWELAAGPTLDLFSDYGSRFNAAAGVTWLYGEGRKLQLSYREGCRAPSYTELNYNSPSSLGTQGLPIQRTETVALDWTVEGDADDANAGIGTCRAGLFYARGKNVVDWLKSSPAAERWTATDLETVDAFGASADVPYRINRALTLVTSGLLTSKRTDADYYASRYAMDYPEAGLSVTLNCRITDEVRAFVRQGVEAWESNPVRRGSSIRNVSGLGASYAPGWLDGVTLSLGIDDLYGQAFEVFPGQKAPGFTAYASVTYRW